MKITGKIAVLLSATAAVVCGFGCTKEDKVTVFENYNMNLLYNDITMKGNNRIMVDYGSKTIELINIIPGEEVLAIGNAKLEGNNISGLLKRDGLTVSVQGTSSDGKLDASITTEIRNDFTGQWQLRQEKASDTESCVSVDITKTDGNILYGDKEMTIEEYRKEFASLGDMIKIVLHELYFRENGFLQANYAADMTNPQFTLSPEGAVSHYTRENTLYLYAHTNTVLTKSETDGLFSLITAGIPLTYLAEGNTMKLTIEHSLLKQILPFAKPIVEKLDESDPIMAIAKPLILNHLNALLQCESYSINIFIEKM